jgi:hypothetical protein
MSLAAGQLFFEGSDTDVWIIQVDSTLTIAANTNMILKGGALSKNIFWAVTAAVTIGTGAHFEGIINTATAVTGKLLCIFVNI